LHDVNVWEFVFSNLKCVIRDCPGNSGVSLKDGRINGWLIFWLNNTIIDCSLLQSSFYNSISKQHEYACKNLLELENGWKNWNKASNLTFLVLKLKGFFPANCCINIKLLFLLWRHNYDVLSKIDVNVVIQWIIIMTSFSTLNFYWWRCWITHVHMELYWRTIHIFLYFNIHMIHRRSQ
jgi:hypothetical protein